MMKVLLTGGKGMLGRTICRVLGNDFEIIPTDLPEADITDENSRLDKMALRLAGLPPMPDWKAALAEFMAQEFPHA